MKAPSPFGIVAAPPVHSASRGGAKRTFSSRAVFNLSLSVEAVYLEAL